MANCSLNGITGEWEMRQGLRSPYIDYSLGWFFITFQVFHNKSVLGAIVGEDCVLNELGEAVRAAWLSEPQHAPGLEIFDFQVMPNHFHALVYYASPGRGGPGTTSSHRATVPGGGPAPRFAPDRCGLLPKQLVPRQYARDSKAHDLPYVIGLFKSWTTKLYHRLKTAGKCIDIGPKLWQESFYDELVRSEEQFANTAAYIRNNPRNWNLDRFGAVTSYAEGNTDLLQSAYVAYLSSEGYVEGSRPGELPMRRISSAGHSGPGTTSGGWATAPTRTTAPAPRSATDRPIISTFTSFYERQLLEKCLRTGRRFIWVCPGGISQQNLEKVSAALANGQALLLSPVAPGTGVNKQRANWCNQFIVRNAEEIWAGHIRAGGSLEAILKGCGRGFVAGVVLV